MKKYILIVFLLLINCNAYAFLEKDLENVSCDKDVYTIQEFDYFSLISEKHLNLSFDEYLWKKCQIEVTIEVGHNSNNLYNTIQLYEQ